MLDDTVEDARTTRRVGVERRRRPQVRPLRGDDRGDHVFVAREHRSSPVADRLFAHEATGQQRTRPSCERALGVGQVTEQQAGVHEVRRQPQRRHDVGDDEVRGRDRARALPSTIAADASMPVTNPSVHGLDAATPAV